VKRLKVKNQRLQKWLDDWTTREQFLLIMALFAILAALILLYPRL
jgi:hypothetical protein